MNHSYQILITSSDYISVNFEFINEVFHFTLKEGEARTKDFFLETSQESLKLTIQIFGSIGSKVEVSIKRISDGFSWSETIRVLKNDEVVKIYSLNSAAFANETPSDLDIGIRNSNEDGARKLQTGAIVPVPYEKSCVINVFYVTNREAIAKGAKEKFQNYNGTPSNVKYGSCQINIPQTRKLGELPRPRWWKLEFAEQPEKHFMILEGSELSGDQFFNTLSSQLNNKNDTLVFIHGFNTTFKQAILRTAQIAFDLGYLGVPISYSWPSKGHVLSYGVDEENIKNSRDSILEFLKDLRLRSGAQRINIIAHSMGNRGLTAALAQLQDEEYFKHFAFNQVILASPDIDADTFVHEIASKMKNCATRMTLYASSKDKALQVSRSKHGSTIRLGESGDRITCCDGLDTIDASKTDPSFLGHGYYAETSALINDIYQLINHNLSPKERNLLQVETHSNRFWKFR